MSDRISVLVVSGSHERLQMAAMLASVGAVRGNDVIVFLSMNALPLFKRGATDQPEAEGAVGAMLAEKKAPPFRTLFEQAVDLGGARIHPCSMAMDLLGYSQEDVEAWLGEPLGLTKFLDDARDGQVWSF